MHILAFEPITGAITAFVLERMTATRPSRIIPHGRILLRRHKELLQETVLSEASDPLVDALSANLHILILGAIMLLVLWRHRLHRL
jgi:hypothetical protein